MMPILSKYVPQPVRIWSSNPPCNTALGQRDSSTPIQTMPQPVNHARRCICGARPKPDGTLPCDH